MSDLVVRPTAKFLKAGAVLAGLVFLALEVCCILYWNAAAGTSLIMIPPVLILLWPAGRALRRRFTKITITADRLRYETGMLSRTIRTIQLPKVQDVRVQQTLFQRMFGIGDIWIETAGEASRETLRHIDDPQGLTDEILNRAQHGTAHL